MSSRLRKKSLLRQRSARCMAYLVARALYVVPRKLTRDFFRSLLELKSRQRAVAARAPALSSRRTSEAATTASSARNASPSLISCLQRNTRFGDNAVAASNIVDRHSGLHRLGDDDQLQLGREAPAGDTANHF